MCSSDLTAVFAGVEGTRPVLVEIQALVAPSSLGTPRRAVVGCDQSRLSMVLAVLEAHCGVKMGGYDVYLNVAGGLRIVEPAADMAAAAALISSMANAPLPPTPPKRVQEPCLGSPLRHWAIRPRPVFGSKPHWSMSKRKAASARQQQALRST